MRWIPWLAVALVVSLVLDAGHKRTAASTRVALLCSKVDEEIWGDFRSCHYDCAGVRRTITIPRVQWCPLLLDR